MGGRQSAYSATSRNARESIVESNRGHKVIVGTGWRVVITTFKLNCIHMQTVVHVMQAVAKIALPQQQTIIMSPLGGIQLIKQMLTPS